MQNPRASVLIATYSYGGNGGISMTIPELSQWTTRTVIEMKGDTRIDRIEPVIISETPITLSRNKTVKIARDKGYDFILMLDSDNLPDGYLGVDPNATPFWDTAFTFAYDRLVKGMPTCIAAPYCGPPPHPVERPGIEDGGEVPYLFQWANKESHDPNAPNKLDIMTRADAAKLSGIYPVAALPTGCCLFTTNCFDGPPKPYFKYEWMDEDQSEKASTEDVYATRNISLYWSIKKGWDVCFATCDSWALHYKPKKVGRPYVIPVEAVAQSMREALETNHSVREKKLFVDFTEQLPERGEVAKVEFDSKTMKRRWDTLGPEDNVVYISDEEYEGFAEMDARDAAPQLVASDPDDDDIPDTNIDNTDLDDNGYSPIVEKSNGKPHALRHKMIGQRKVAILDYELTDESVEGIQSITNWLVGKLNGGVDVAVVHPGTGQGTSAILSCLPPMSRIVAFDSVSQYASSDYAKHFTIAFQKELEAGLVKADVDGKRFPATKNYKVDMTFIENFVTAGKLETWLKAVSPKGVLAGMGYHTPAIMELVEAFRTKNELPIQANGDLWVIPVGGIANAAG